MRRRKERGGGLQTAHRRLCSAHPRTPFLQYSPAVPLHRFIFDIPQLIEIPALPSSLQKL
jgi:hypothetical protein